MPVCPWPGSPKRSTHCREGRVHARMRMTQPLHIAIVGASGGIGAAMLEALSQRDDVAVIHATYHQSPAGSALGSITNFGGSTDIHWTAMDASVDASVAAWVESLGSIDWLINCVGMLHTQSQGPEKSIRQLDADHFSESMRINCLPSLLLGKYARNALKDSPAGVFATLSARVGSITDNGLGGWYSYRASKAALNMSLKCLAIEWARNTKNVRVAALHPGTTDSRLSKPFQKNVPDGQLFSAQKTAGLLIEQMESLHQYPSGRFIAYDGEEIPW